MKRIVSCLAALVIAASLLGLSACRHDDGGSEAANPTNVPVITQSPGGEVTAGPTATPEATPAPTDVPVITQSPGGEVTAGPTATPEVTPAPTAVPTAAPTSPAGPTAGPTSAPTPAVPTPEAPNSFTVTYSGETVDCSSLKVGDKFFWTLILSSGSSSLASGRWLVDHDERFVKPVAFSTTWEGGLIAQIDETWDNEQASSDKPDFFVNIEYEGATGPNPYGEAGNLYSVVGMYLTSMSYGGVQASGPMVRIEYEVTAVPNTGDMQHDAGGYYLPVGVIVIESKALNGGSPVTHGSITAEPGRMYFKH